jgi:HTH-type transcriptional regulator/antitoxin HipB
MTEQITRTPQQVGAVLRRRRRALGLVQLDLGRQTGSRQSTISSLEAGAAGTRLRTLFDALAALDLELVIRPRTKAPADTIEDAF